MRGLFGILSLVLAAAVIGLLVKKQLSPVSGLKAPQVNSTAASAQQAGSAKDQSTQIQQQFKAAAEAAVQQARPIADDK